MLGTCLGGVPEPASPAWTVAHWARLGVVGRRWPAGWWPWSWLAPWGGSAYSRERGGCGGSLRRHAGKGCLRLVMQHPSALHRLCTQSICAGDRVSRRMRGSTGQPAREGLSLRDWRGTVHGGQPLQQPHQLSSLHWCKHGQLESLRNMILSPTTSARATDNWSLLRLSRACFVILLGLRIGWKCVSVRPHSCFPPDTLTLCCANFLSVEYNSPRHYHQPSVPC